MRVLFLGTGGIGIPSLRSLFDIPDIECIGVVTQPDRPIGRHQHTPMASPIKEVALQKKIPIFQPENINDVQFVEKIKELRPYLCVVCAYGQILKKPILNVPLHGHINIHASLLPKYRGAACIRAAIAHGDLETGITIIQVEEGLDSGDILWQKAIPIESTDTSDTLQDRLAQIAPEGLRSVIHQIKEGTLKPCAQDHSLAIYAKKLAKEDGLINWNQPASTIERHIRAMIPWPTAYTQLSDGKILKIFSAKEVPENRGIFGEIIGIDKNSIIVAAAQGALTLQEVQLEGKKRMHAGDFARGHQILPGTKLGIKKAC